MRNRQYICIDLKSFYASAECRDRDYDPLNANLVVADESRTEKTICLAVSPALKSLGIPGRARLFEVIERVKQVNLERKKAYGKKLEGESIWASELAEDPSRAVSFEIARPRMARYMEISTHIYNIYMHYVAPEDMHVYSIDEVFMDVTAYLDTYRMTAAQLCEKLILLVQEDTGITATGGVGSNLYLAKVAMDVLAKHMQPNEKGVRIAELDEQLYRRLFWAHQPITDFWRIGRGTQRKLAENGMFTLGDVARCSIGSRTDFYNEDLLYRLFGKNAELLIDHAWGWEPCTIADIKAYVPENNSLSIGQVLQEPYPFDKAAIIVREMTDSLVMDLADKGLVTNQVALNVGYDRISLTGETAEIYEGEVKEDFYGRTVPAPVHGSANLSEYTSSTMQITEAMMGLFERIVDPALYVRRLNVVADHVLTFAQARERQQKKDEYRQMDLFTDFGDKIYSGGSGGRADGQGIMTGSDSEREKRDRARQDQERLEQERLEKERLEKEKKIQEAVLSIRKRYGKNALLKGTNLQQGATAMERNRQIGGHKA